MGSLAHNRPAFQAKLQLAAHYSKTLRSQLAVTARPKGGTRLITLHPVDMVRPSCPHARRVR